MNNNPSLANADQADNPLLSEQLDYSNEAHLLSSEQNQALKELRMLAGEEIKGEHYSPKFTIPQDSSDSLETYIHQFQKKHAASINEYLEYTQKRKIPPSHDLLVLNGWNFDERAANPSMEIINPSLLTEDSRQSLGGHYIRWAGKGIVINPGPGFIKLFHEQGLRICDIDFVIVTCNNPSAYKDVKAISELNSQLNKSSPELHIIQYYLHYKVRQELSSLLKPTFKQARNTVHNLEMFIDSPDVEEIILNEYISLHYFQCASQGSFQIAKTDDDNLGNSSLGIRLELSDESKQVSIGYLSNIGWNALIAHHLSHCDLILAGFGNTGPRDYAKLAYNKHNLGYAGCYSLLEEVSPKLLLLTEFAGREGDIRLQAVKKMRQEYAASGQNNGKSHSIVLPADIGLSINLYSLNIRCSVSEESVSASQVRVIASTEDFGRLQFLSPSYCL